jgi:MFS family permease
MKKQIFFWSLVSALAGFLFGFDTVVISGAEKTIQTLWGLSDRLHGIAVGSALYGTVLGALLGSWPTDHFGRKKTLLSIGVLYLISAIGTALAPGVYIFLVARFIGGLGIGISTVAAPLYISEIAPPKYRGRLAGMFQFNIVFGILVAYLSNYLLAKTGDNAWRWMLGVAAFPSILYTIFCFGIPESPRWLLGRGEREKGVAVLKLIQPEAAPAELETLANSIVAASSVRTESSRFWSRQLRIPIMLAILIAFFNQLSGINAILYFAPRIFEMTGLGAKTALLQSVGIGFTNLIFTFVGLWLIDRLGRRTLLFIGSFGYIISLGLCAFAFFHWAPQFKVATNVATTATALVEMTARVEKAAPGDQAKLTAGYADAKQALITASADPGFTPGPVTIPDQAAPEDVKKIADDIMDKASELVGAGGKMVLLCIFAFIASHAVGQGAVIWVFISEIFPNKYRAEGQTLGCSTHWIFAALLVSVFPIIVTSFPPGYVFAFFAGMMVLQLIWVAFMVPETKGVALEDMAARLESNRR